jgi:hypothetical protein
MDGFSMNFQSTAGVVLVGRIASAFLTLATLGGCRSNEVGLGMRIMLDKVPVTALSATLSPDRGLAPGKSARLIISATTSDAKQFVTVGSGNGNVLFDSFRFKATAVTVDTNGVVSLSADPRVSDGALLEVMSRDEQL